ncbi:MULTISPECIES: YdcF family protein [unclassified Caballeronia]|jgi:vancomycin permeability regulator SanA|uniref:YdcF family protein n=1 Tax=unclassified Caballeronia TaxID=2646786 RepID=UPI00202838AD|nr:MULTISPECIES: YdcF family protein [unclassified Caballeronia]
MLCVAVATALLWFIAAALICLRGITMPYDDADVAVVFGNALLNDGTPKSILAARLDAALKCHRAGHCPVLFVSGSIDGPGLNEARSMQTWLIRHGVEQEAIVVDEHGDNTLASARNAVTFMREHRMTRVLLVTQYYHLARASLAFERAGARLVLGAFPREFRVIDVYSSWREVPAYAVYFFRLAANADAKPVSFRPVQFLMRLISRPGW